MKLNLIPIEPIGTYRSPTFTDYADGSGSLRMMEHKEYPRTERGEAMRAARMHVRLTMRDASGVLGIPVAEFSDLENGRCTLSEDQWQDAIGAILTAGLSSPPAEKTGGQQG